MMFVVQGSNHERLLLLGRTRPLHDAPSPAHEVLAGLRVTRLPVRARRGNPALVRSQAVALLRPLRPAPGPRWAVGNPRPRHNAPLLRGGVGRGTPLRERWDLPPPLGRPPADGGWGPSVRASLAPPPPTNSSPVTTLLRGREPRSVLPPCSIRCLFSSRFCVPRGAPCRSRSPARSSRLAALQATTTLLSPTGALPGFWRSKGPPMSLTSASYETISSPTILPSPPPTGIRSPHPSNARVSLLRKG